MTPDQTEIILEEYVAMNRPPEEQGAMVDINDMKGESVAAPRPQLSPEGADLGARVKAEMAEKLGRVSAQIQGT